MHLHESSFTYQLLPLLSAFPGAKKKNPAFDFFLSVVYIKERYCIYMRDITTAPVQSLLWMLGYFLEKKKKSVTFGRKTVLPILKCCNECQCVGERQTAFKVQLHNSVTGKFTEDCSTIYFVGKVVQVWDTQIFGDGGRWKSTLLRDKRERAKLLKWS